MSVNEAASAIAIVLFPLTGLERHEALEEVMRRGVMPKGWWPREEDPISKTLVELRAARKAGRKWEP